MKSKTRLPKKGSTIKERICSHGSKFILFRIDPFSEGRKNNVDNSLKVYHFPLNLSIRTLHQVRNCMVMNWTGVGTDRVFYVDHR